MPAIQLPDGSKLDFDNPVTGAEIASGISKSLAKDAVAIRVDGELWDLSRSIENDASVEIIKRESEDGLERRGARDGRGRQGALAGDPGDDRAGYRERLLL
jgi:hypothetical protein